MVFHLCRVADPMTGRVLLATTLTIIGARTVTDVKVPAPIRTIRLVPLPVVTQVVPLLP